jgi:phage tail sheath protein FI
MPQFFFPRLKVSCPVQENTLEGSAPCRAVAGVYARMDARRGVWKAPAGSRGRGCVPVRRTALFIEESLYRGLKWVVFEPNDEPPWGSIRL